MKKNTSKKKGYTYYIIQYTCSNYSITKEIRGRRKDVHSTVQYTENTVYAHNYNKKTCKRKDILFYNRNWTWEQEGRIYNMLYTHSSTTCILYTTKKEGVIYTIHYTKYISFPFPPGSFPQNVICPPASPKYKITLLVS